MNQNYSVHCQKLTLSVGFRPLLREVSLSALAGEQIALTGPNGCGKTTLLRSLAGIARPQSGRVEVMGEEVWPSRKSRFESIAVFLASQPALLLDQNVAQNLEFMANAFGVDPRFVDLHASVERVGLLSRERQAVRTLSTGQKRRLTLAALLLLRPRVVFADEPTNGLDVDGARLCNEIFSELRREYGCSILVASHDQSFIEFCTSTLDVASFAPRKRGAK